MPDIDYQKFIESEFDIIDREGKVVPFKFFPIQQKYMDILNREYRDMEGVREILLKARQEGMSSFILALFTVDFITQSNSVSICISHRKDATRLLFRKVKFYLESYCKKHGWDLKDYLLSDNKNEIENRTNGAFFYIGTASSKVGGRGGTASNVLFSEAAYYEDSEIITAREIIEGTAQQVPQGKGKIFIESTGNGFGNFYQLEWARAERGESNYRPRFFGWEEFYTEEWVRQKRKDFQSREFAAQEYPSSPQEAFIHSGNPYFDVKAMQWHLENVVKLPEQQGRLATDGQFL